jgi:transmembrane sensor
MDRFPPQELVVLIVNYLKEDLSASDRDKLDQWIAEAPENAEVIRKLEDPVHLITLMVLLDEADLKKSWERILPTLVESHEIAVPSSRRLPWRWMAVAAASVLIIIAGVYYWKDMHATTVLPAVVSVADPVTIQPGRNTAVLTLSGGQKVLLDSVQNGGTAALQGGYAVVKQEGRLSYNGSYDPDKNKGLPVAYNTLTTPKAGQFALSLPDGTRVWLNNASSLHYPTAFTGDTRTVELTGEGYFEVAKDASKPFQVKINDLTVKVLATAFNVMAYPDEEAIRTTLIQGKVEVMKKNQQTILHPGEQVAATPAGDWKVLESVNTEEITDWKKGLFNFDHADLPSVLRQLARWYDIEVEFKGSVPDKHIQGQMHRDLSLTQVLEILTDKDIHFTIIGRKLIVTP